MCRLLVVVAMVVVAMAWGVAAAGQQVSLTGAGSSFAYPLYSQWASEYGKLHAGTQINYQSIGSGGGVRQMTAGTIDFGGTDGPMTGAQEAAAQRALGTDLLHFPVAVGADVPIYNIPGVGAGLRFSADALAGIFLGKITRWNDPYLARNNPGVNLPARDILVCHRSDSSGTTFVWVDYLSKVSPEWKSRVGTATSVHWPTGIGGKGNEGVAGFVRQAPYSIGYVELIYAAQNRIAYGAVQNASGEFVKATLESVDAAAAVQGMPADFRVSIVNAPGKGSYPVSSFTWMLVPREMKDKSKGAALKAFLLWAITEGQAATAPLSYAPLPKPVVAQEIAALKMLRY